MPHVPAPAGHVRLLMLILCAGLALPTPLDAASKRRRAAASKRSKVKRSKATRAKNRRAKARRGKAKRGKRSSKSAAARKARQRRWIATMKRRCSKRKNRRSASCRSFAKNQRKRKALARYRADRKYCARRSRRKTRRCKTHARAVRKRRLHWRICGRGYGRARHRESVRSFARRYRVSVSSVRAWNRLGRTHRLKKGRRYVIRKSPLEGQRLSGGTLLTPERGLLAMQRPQRGWGRPVTVQAIRAAARAVQDTWPERDRLIVGDLSKRGGGCLPPHKSHRGGLDADIGYYQRDGVQRNWMTLATPATVDADRTWLFLKAMLASGQLRYAFIDYGLQKPLYEAARLAGESTQTLARVFQYPRPKSATRSSVFRHLRGHADHMHVRFTCPGKSGCKLASDVVERIRTARLERRHIKTNEAEIAEEDREDGEIAVDHGDDADADDEAPPEPADSPADPPADPAADPADKAPPPAVGPTGGVPAGSAP